MYIARMAGTFNKSHLIRSADLFTLKLFLSVMREGQVGRAADGNAKLGQVVVEVDAARTDRYVAQREQNWLL